MRSLRVSSGSTSRRAWQSTGSAATLAALLAIALPAGGHSGPPVPAWPLAEPLSAALASGRIRAEDLRGREVYADDETHIGTLAAAADAAVIILDPRLGLGRGCVATPLGRVWLAEERRLMLFMTPYQFEAVLAAKRSCGG